MKYSPASGDKNPEGALVVEGRPRNDNSNPQQGTDIEAGMGTGKEMRNEIVEAGKETPKPVEKLKGKEKGKCNGKEIPDSSKMSPSASSVALSDRGSTASGNINTSQVKGSNNHNKTQHNKKDPRKLFVGGLPSDVTDKEFREFFEQHGVVLDSVVMYDRETHRSRGFGFVTFQDPDVAARLLNMGQGQEKTDENNENSPQKIGEQHPRVGRLEMRGKTCEVKAAEPKESRLSRGRPTSAAQAPLSAGPLAVSNTAAASNVSNTRFPAESQNNSHRSSKGFVGSEEGAREVPVIAGGGGAPPVPPGGPPPHHAMPTGFLYPPHFHPHDMNAGPFVHGGPPSFFHPYPHGVPQNFSGHHIPPQNQMMHPFPHGGEMHPPHHPGFFMAPAPLVGTHMADGPGMFMDGSVPEGYQHFLPPHQPYWFMMQQQQHLANAPPPQFAHPHGASNHNYQHHQHPRQPPMQNSSNHNSNSNSNKSTNHTGGTPTASSNSMQSTPLGIPTKPDGESANNNSGDENETSRAS